MRPRSVALGVSGGWPSYGHRGADSYVCLLLPRTISMQHRPGSRVTELAGLIQIFPAPWFGWAAVGFPAEPEAILAVLLPEEELKHACPR
jgi:hypothetical protein